MTSRQSVSFDSAGRTLRGTLIRPGTPAPSSPALVFAHGWKSSQQSYLARAESLADEGFIGLIFDMHGHGESDGDDAVLDSSQTKSFLADLLAAHDFLVGQNGVDTQRVGIVAASFGAYLAAFTAVQRHIRWLALRAPTDRQNGQLGSALDALASFQGDLLVIESELDEVIPHDVVEGYTRAVMDPARVRYEIIRGATHALDQESWRAQFIDILRRWFRDRLAASR